MQSLQDKKLRYRLKKKVKKSKNDDFLKKGLNIIFGPHHKGKKNDDFYFQQDLS